MTEGNKRLALLAAAGVGVYLGARTWLRWRRAYDFHGKTVLITGGSRGLGLLLARQLGAQGARLAICARDPAELERARDELERRGFEVLARLCDVTDRQQVEDLVRTVIGRFGRIDVLINNAGVIQVGPQNVMTLKDYEEAMNTHFWGPLYTTLAVLPEMRRRQDGRIVNISSIGGKISVPHLLPYSASKFALTGFSEGLRAELAREGVLVTTVCPGLMRTGSPDNADFKGRHREEYTWFSLGDALPGLSMSAERAAGQIIAACKHGAAEVVLSLPAQVAVRFHGLFPGLTADLLSLVNRLLPEAADEDTRRFKGRESHSPLAPSWLTALSDRAARRNNEM